MSVCPYVRMSVCLYVCMYVCTYVNIHLKIDAVYIYTGSSWSRRGRKFQGQRADKQEKKCQQAVRCPAEDLCVAACWSSGDGIWGEVMCLVVRWCEMMWDWCAVMWLCALVHWEVTSWQLNAWKVHCNAASKPWEAQRNETMQTGSPHDGKDRSIDVAV